MTDKHESYCALRDDHDGDCAGVITTPFFVQRGKEAVSIFTIESAINKLEALNYSFGYVDAQNPKSAPVEEDARVELRNFIAKELRTLTASRVKPLSPFDDLEVGQSYCFKYRERRGEGILEAIYAQDGDCVLYAFTIDNGRQKVAVRREAVFARAVSKDEVSRVARIIDNFWKLHSVEPATGFTPEELAREILK